MNPTPQVLSNEIEDFQEGGGLYPGGTGLIKEFTYALWDYNGTKPKDSFCAARMTFHPIDGSNEGKAVIQYYNVGSSSEYLPDNTGGNVISLRGKNFMDSTNWGHFLKTLRNGCGLEKGKLSGPTGIRVMDNAIMTVVKADQPHREFDELPATPEKGKEKKTFKPSMLLPTRAVFTWDPNYASATRNVPPPVTSTQAPPPIPAQTAPGASPTAQAPVMTQNGDYTLSTAMKALMSQLGSLPVGDLAKVLAEGPLRPPFDRVKRLAICKEAKNLAMVATAVQENGWTMAGDDIIG